jgi:hypothetical protein
LCSGRIGGKLAQMAFEPNPRVTVELELGADPIRGSIEQVDGQRQRFWGWLELIEALRRLAADASAAPGEPGPTNNLGG